ncbi:TPA: hypothetical protein N0F65_010959, partial [Lagenidium giganteum]
GAMVFRSLARNVLHLQRPAAKRVAQCAAARPLTHPHGLFQAVTAARSTSVPPAPRPVHVQADVTGVLAGVALVGALVGVGKMWWDASAAPAKKYPATPKPAPAVVDIPREDIAKFFTDLIASIRMVFEHIPQLEEELRAELKKQNITLTEEEFKQALLEQLYQVMNQIEVQIVGSRGWAPQSMEAAFAKFAEDAEIQQLQEELRQLMTSVFPSQSVEIPDHLTEDKAVEILRQLVEGMEIAMRETIEHARGEGITDPAKALEEFQSLYLEQVEAFTAKHLQAHGITNQIFTAALQKYHAESETFKKKVEQIYAKQAESFRKMGLEVHDA